MEAGNLNIEVQRQTAQGNKNFAEQGSDLNDKR
jgi:hypothetical protein